MQAIHRQGNAPQPGRIRAQNRRRRHPHLLHGQKHARAQRLHHGKPRRAGGRLILTNNDIEWHLNAKTIPTSRNCRSKALLVMAENPNRLLSQRLTAKNQKPPPMATATATPMFSPKTSSQPRLSGLSSPATSNFLCTAESIAVFSIMPLTSSATVPFR